MKLRAYAGLFRPHLGPLLVVVAAASAGGLLPAAAVLALREGAVKAAAGEPLWGAGMAVLTIFSLDAALKVGRVALSKRVAWAVVGALREALQRSLLARGPLRREATGAQLALLTGEVDELQYGVSATVSAIRYPVTLAGLALTAAALAPRLALYALAVAPLFAWVSRWSSRQQRRLSQEVVARRVALSALAEEQLAGQQTLHHLGALEDEIRRFSERNAQYSAARRRLDVLRQGPAALTSGLGALAVLGLLAVGGHEVSQGRLDAAALLGFGAAVALMTRPLGSLSESWTLLQRALVAYEAVANALAVPAHPPEAVAVQVPPSGPLGVRWEAVRAGWGGAEVLGPLTLEARAGEQLWVAGPSGSGKSTLLALVTRWLEASAGEVRLSGVAVGSIPAEVLRKRVAWVRGEDALFARSIHDNLQMGRGLETGALREAMRQAQAEFADLGRALGPGGEGLSTGQGARLRLARALAGRPDLLLLDEVTASVDPDTARAIRASLSEWRGRVTVVFVTHDLSGAENADSIAWIEGGQLRTVGPPAEVLPQIQAIP